MILSPQRQRAILSAHRTPQARIVLPEYQNNNAKTQAFHDSRGTKVRAIFGGDRAGKSEPGGFEMVDLIRTNPNTLGWACAMTYGKLKINAEKIFKYLAKWEISEVAWANRAMRIPALIRHINGSVIEFKTYNSGVGAFASDSVNWIWLDEDPQRAVPNGEEIFVECLQRTIDCNGMVWLTGTPVLGKNWMHKRIYLSTSPDVKHWTMSLLENRFIPDEEKERARAMLTEDEINRRFYGLFSSLTGACFKELNSDIHFIDSFPIPATWRKIRGIDLGYKHPFVCVWAALSDDGTLYIYGEHYHAETLLQDHAAMIRETERNPDWYEDFAAVGASSIVETTVCDHARQERAELENHGIFTEPANKEVDLSIAVINRLFKQRRLFVFRDRCPHLCEEVENYRYMDNTHGGKEQPLKVNDDAVDAFRYAVMYFFGDDDAGEWPEHGEQSEL